LRVQTVGAEIIDFVIYYIFLAIVDTAWAKWQKEIIWFKED
jgi:hypothetical protein